MKVTSNQTDVVLLLVLVAMSLATMLSAGLNLALDVGMRGIQ